MKSILVGPKSGEEKPPKYPYIGLSKKGRVVLFTANSVGALLHALDDDYGIGVVSETWAESEFEPLEGKIILSND